MTPEQSAVREVLAAAIDCFDFENLLGAVPITHDAFDDLRDACTPENIRAILAALDEAQQDAARFRWLLTTDGDWAICEWDSNEVEGIGYYRDARDPATVRAAIDAAREWSAT